jgi:hypothetical protein
MKAWKEQEAVSMMGKGRIDDGEKPMVTIWDPLEQMATLMQECWWEGATLINIMDSTLQPTRGGIDNVVSKAYLWRVSGSHSSS